MQDNLEKNKSRRREANYLPKLTETKKKKISRHFVPLSSRDRRWTGIMRMRQILLNHVHCNNNNCESWCIHNSKASVQSEFHEMITSQWQFSKGIADISACSGTWCGWLSERWTRTWSRLGFGTLWWRSALISPLSRSFLAYLQIISLNVTGKDNYNNIAAMYAPTTHIQMTAHAWKRQHRECAKLGANGCPS